MKTEGFTVEPTESWHFNYKNAKEYPIMDVRFEDLSPDDCGLREETQLLDVVSHHAAANPAEHLIRNCVFESGVVPGGDATMIAGTHFQS